MDKTTKIGSIEAIALIIIIMVNELLFNVPKVFLNTSGTGAIINIIYITIIAVLFCVILSKLFKSFSNNDILDVSEFLGGKLLKVIVGILFIGLFLIYNINVLRNFCDIIKSIYFPKTPLIVLAGAFLIGAIFLNKLGFKGITLSNLVILPFVLITLLIIFLCAMPSFRSTNFFPILGNGLNSIFFNGLSNIYAFSGVFILFFILPYINKKEEHTKISVVRNYYFFYTIITKHPFSIIKLSYICN